MSMSEVEDTKDIVTLKTNESISFKEARGRCVLFIAQPMLNVLQGAALHSAQCSLVLEY